jgi:hypothetical protein
LAKKTSPLAVLAEMNECTMHPSILGWLVAWLVHIGRKKNQIAEGMLTDCWRAEITEVLVRVLTSCNIFHSHICKIQHLDPD